MLPQILLHTAVTDHYPEVTLFIAVQPHCEFFAFKNLRLEHVHNSLHNIASRVIEFRDLNAYLASIPPIQHKFYSCYCSMLQTTTQRHAAVVFWSDRK